MMRAGASRFGHMLLRMEQHCQNPRQELVTARVLGGRGTTSVAMARIPEQYRDLLGRAALDHVATPGSKGESQTNPVRFRYGPACPYSGSVIQPRRASRTAEP